MKILKDIYEGILTNTPFLPPETGGILGGKNGVITNTFFDVNTSIHSSPTIYFPDIKLFNTVIDHWNNTGILFLGIFHSHNSQFRELSNGDKKYITKIMESMPPEVDTLYFPIVIPELKEIIGFQAHKSFSGISINFEEIELL